MRVRLSALFLTLVFFITCVCSCSKVNNDYPVLSTDLYSENSNALVPDENIDEDSEVEDTLTEITVALPYSDQTISLLFKLYYAKLNNLFPENQTGADISLEYLDAIDIPWIINSISVPDDGVSTDTVSSWNTDSIIPDLMLVNDYSELVSKGYITSLNDYIYDDTLISSNNINSVFLNSFTSEGLVYGVPHYFSTMILIGNTDYIPADSRLSFRPSIDEFSEYLNEIDSCYNSDEDTVVVFARGYELLPYLSSAFNGDISSPYMFDLLNSNSSYIDSLDDAVQYISDLYDEGLSLDYDYNDADPTISRNAALWISSSSMLDLYDEYYQDNLYYSLIPSYNSENDVNLYSTVYPLCVSSSSNYQDFVAGFASFISFDSDALELIWRLESPLGLFPVTNDSSVWNSVYTVPVFGTESMIIQQYMDHIIVCPSRGTTSYLSVNDYNSLYFNSLIEGGNEDYDLGGYLND